MSNGAILPSERAGETGSSCCAPGRGANRVGRGEVGARAGGTADGRDASLPERRVDVAGTVDRTAATTVALSNATAAIVALPGGCFRMGSDDRTFPADREGPVREVEVAAFGIDSCAVTNYRFAEFVADTGYVTEAERFGWSFVFKSFLSADHPPTRAVAAAPWWRVVPGADWSHPFGPRSDLDDRRDHPVVHMSWHDAAAFARWAGGRLPREAEWEYAARGGLDQKRFPWGDRLVDGKRHRCNVWQGSFPDHDHARDGYHGTAPARSFEPNGFGLYNVVGNVWEWCADPWEEPRDGEVNVPRVMKGGSHLCHASYCNRYRLSARSSSTDDSSIGHVGFRVAYDPASDLAHGVARDLALRSARVEEQARARRL